MFLFTVLGFIFAGIIAVFFAYILFLVLRQITHSHKEIMDAMKSWDGKNDMLVKFSNCEQTYVITIRILNEWFAKHTWLYMYYTMMKFCLRKFV